MAGQFYLPRGKAGSLTGWIMVWTNRWLYKRALSKMADNLLGNAKIIEIGFGPGIGIKMLAERFTNSDLIAGIDPSEVMIRQAENRNKKKIQLGTAKLVKGRADSIPFPDDTFDGALVLNNFFLWGEPYDRSLSELRRVLKSNSLVIIGYAQWVAKDQVKKLSRTVSSIKGPDEEIVNLLNESGSFNDIRIEKIGSFAKWGFLIQASTIKK
jgi:ubiquinone/menaquinone biosynthesis C-methylase UbiE